MANNTTNTSLHILFCLHIDLPPSGVDCSEQEPNQCFKCRTRGYYFTGEKLSASGSTALGVMYFLWVFLLLVSLIGMVNNVFIIRVMRQTGSKKCFDFLISLLAYADLVCAITSGVAGTATMAYVGDWSTNKRQASMWSISTTYIFFASRSVSTFVTIVITVERFVMVTWPFHASQYFTLKTSKIFATGCVALGLLFGTLRLLSFEHIDIPHKDIPSLTGLDFIVKTTATGKFIYQTLKWVHSVIDFWIPLPALFLLNLLSYLKVRQISKRRRELKKTEKDEMNAVKMFLPVIVIYFLSNVIFIINLITTILKREEYREIFMLMYLSISFNSAVNFPIYYFRSSSFQKNAQEMFKSIGWFNNTAKRADEQMNAESQLKCNDDNLSSRSTNSTSVDAKFPTTAQA